MSRLGTRTLLAYVIPNLNKYSETILIAKSFNYTYWTFDVVAYKYVILKSHKKRLVITSIINAIELSIRFEESSEDYTIFIRKTWCEFVNFKVHKRVRTCELSITWTPDGLYKFIRANYNYGM